MDLHEIDVLSLGYGCSECTSVCLCVHSKPLGKQKGNTFLTGEKRKWEMCLFKKYLLCGYDVEGGPHIAK